jgi:hypothetical protein
MLPSKALEKMRQNIDEAEEVIKRLNGDSKSMHIIECKKCEGDAVSPTPKDPYSCSHCGWTSKPNGETL